MPNSHGPCVLPHVSLYVLPCRSERDARKHLTVNNDYVQRSAKCYRKCLYFAVKLLQMSALSLLFSQYWDQILVVYGHVTATIFSVCRDTYAPDLRIQE